MTQKDESPNFETVLARLETIVAEMEAGKLSLDECIKRFEEGMKCATFCTEKLNETQKKIETLLRRTDGTAVWAPMEPAAADGAAAEPSDAGDDGDDEVTPPASGPARARRS